MSNQRTLVAKQCPKFCETCGGETMVRDSRISTRTQAIRRRRKCLKCGHRFTTYEVTDDDMKQYIRNKKIITKLTEVIKVN